MSAREPGVLDVGAAVGELEALVAKVRDGVQRTLQLDAGRAGTAPQAAPPNEADVTIMLAMVRMYQVSQALYVAAELGIADLLADGPKSCDALARSAGAQRRSLYRLLRVLVSLGVLTEHDREHFSLTSWGSTLRTEAAGSVRAAIITGRILWSRLGQLLDVVRTGQPDKVFGRTLYDSLADGPPLGEMYDTAMNESTAQAADASRRLTISTAPNASSTSAADMACCSPPC